MSDTCTLPFELVVEDGKSFYKVPAKLCAEFIKDSAILQALNNGGVDNWDWHGDAMDEVDEIQSQMAEGYGVVEAKP